MKFLIKDYAQQPKGPEDGLEIWGALQIISREHIFL